MDPVSGKESRLRFRLLHQKGSKMAKHSRITVGFIPIVLLAFSMAYGQGVINLPKTGQTGCYDSAGTEIACYGTGQDGEWQAGVKWPNPRFTVSGDCVTDKLTGLMWAKNGNLPGKPLNWYEALDYVASINSGAGLCGYKDWCLPNVNELESLINAEVADSANWLNSQGFVNVQSGSSFYYWSSTRQPASGYNPWIVNILDGFVENTASAQWNLYFVWLVRSERGEARAQLWKTGQTSSYAPGDDGNLQRCHPRLRMDPP